MSSGRPGQGDLPYGNVMSTVREIPVETLEHITDSSENIWRKPNQRRYSQKHKIFWFHFFTFLLFF
jgi:hypothetical protein